MSSTTLKLKPIKSWTCPKKKHWFEVKRYINGQSDPDVTIHKSMRATLNAVKKAEATHRYEAVVWDEYDEDGIID